MDDASALERTELRGSGTTARNEPENDVQARDSSVQPILTSNVQMESPSDESDAAMLPDKKGIWQNENMARQWYRGFSANAMLASFVSSNQKSSKSTFKDDYYCWNALFPEEKPSADSDVLVSEAPVPQWKELCKNAPALKISEEDVSERMRAEGADVYNEKQRATYRHNVDAQLVNEVIGTVTFHTKHSHKSHPQLKQRAFIGSLATTLFALVPTKSKQLTRELHLLTADQLALLYAPIHECLCCGKEGEKEEVDTETVRMV